MKKCSRISVLFTLTIIAFIIAFPVNVFCDEQEGSSGTVEAQLDIQSDITDGEESSEYEEAVYEEQSEELTDDEAIYDEQSGELTDDETMDTVAEEKIVYSRAKVLKVLSEESSEINYSGGSIQTNKQVVEALVIKGPYLGEKVIADCELNFGFGDKYKAIKLEPGDEVFLGFYENEDGAENKAYVAEVARDKYLLYLVIGFFIILVLVGRLKGLKAVISLALTAVAVWKLLLPAILNGWDPVLVSVGICIAVISVTMIIISGFNRKTFSAVVGTVGGVLIAGIIALIIGSLAKLTGFGDDDSQMLLFIPQNIQFDFRGLLFSGIIIGTMGATMDVGMSIASAMNEIKVNSPEISTMGLIKAGMNVGRDTMATMANTLILAYAGGSLHLMLLLMAHNTPFSDIINWDLIASEVLRAIAGSIGIVFAIPFTALTAGLLEEYKKRENRTGGVDFRF